MQRDTLRHDTPGELLCDMATRQKVPAACIMLVQMSVRVTLFGAPPQKDFEARLQQNQKAFAYGTEAGSGSHLANQEASGAGKAFAYGTGAGGRSHLAKLRDGARHCAELYAALRDGARHCNSALSLSRFCCEFSLGRLRRLGAPPQRKFAAKTRDSVHRP